MSNIFLGADVSKGYADIAVIDITGKEVCRPKKYYDTPDGHAALQKQIEALLATPGVTGILAATESTGGYENNWMSLFSRLHGAGFPLQSARLNPRQTCNYGKMGLVRTITDKVSAEIIADFLRCCSDKVRFNEEDVFKSLRRLWSSRELIMKAYKAQVQNLRQLLYDSNPGMLQYMQKHISAWMLAVLRKYPTAAKLSRANVKTLASIRYVTLERAEELISQAKRSIARDDELITELLIVQTIATMRDLDKHMQTLEQAILAEAAKHPEAALIDSISGIGPLSAAGLLIYIGNVSRFPDVKHLASYFGLHPVYKESGDGKTVSRMSKAGQGRPRSVLYMAVLSGIKNNPILRKTFHDAKSHGKNSMSALGICMHKLLRIVYGVLKSGKVFDVSIHDSHVARGVAQTKTVAQQASEQAAFDVAAPVSAREAKKRKKKSGPHGGITPSNTGSPPSP